VTSASASSTSCSTTTAPTAWALALKGYVKLPTADEAKGLGTGKASFGGNLILSKSLNHTADVHATIGYQINSDPDALDIGNAFEWGFGINVPALRIFQLQAELVGKSYSGGDFEQTGPIDFVVGPVIHIKPGWFVRPALSWNLAFDDRGLNSGTQSSTGIRASIGYHPGTPRARSTCRLRRLRRRPTGRRRCR